MQILLLILWFAVSPLALADDILSGPFQIDTPDYDLHGSLFCQGQEDTSTTCESGTVIYIYRAGGTHGVSAGASIRHRTFNVSRREWSSETVIYTDPNGHDVRDPRGGVIGSTIYIFFNVRAVDAPNTAISQSLITTTDPTGASGWSTPTQLITGYAANQKGNTSTGGLSRTSNASTFLQPIFYHTNEGNGTWHVGFLKTTNAGSTWTTGTPASIDTAIYNTARGSTRWSETSITYAGNQRLLALIRRDSGGYLGQSTSTDDGVTWTNPDTDLTNLGDGLDREIPIVLYDAARDLLICVFHDRNDDTTKISMTDADLPFQDPDFWQASVDLATYGLGNGYPQIVKICASEYLIVYSDEKPDSCESGCPNSDLYWLTYGTAASSCGGSGTSGISLGDS